jgi:hypothetical protein
MPTRRIRPRKTGGLRQYLPMLYEKPALKFLKHGEPWEPIADLLFGPSTSWPTPEEIEKLEPVWFELRDDILKAQAFYAPDKKPWGCRFDRTRR